MPAAFDDLMLKIRSEEDVGGPLRIALLAASREIEGGPLSNCTTCATHDKTFAFCTNTRIYGGTCPECILKGVRCDGSREAFKQELDSSDSDDSSDSGDPFWRADFYRSA
jgi:hypothetical protein